MQCIPLLYLSKVGNYLLFDIADRSFRYALVLGAKTIYLTYFLLIITFPLAYPISKAIAFILGPVPGISYSRDELRQLLILTHHRTDMGKAEVDMLMGALQVWAVVI